MNQKLFVMRDEGAHHSIESDTVCDTTATGISLPASVSTVGTVRVPLGLSRTPSVTSHLHGNGAMLPLGARGWAQQLLAQETAADKTSGSAESAAIRVYEKLRRSLCALAGVAGYRSLAARALTLARAKAPSLNEMQITADGSLQVIRKAESESNELRAGEGRVILLAELLGLLHAFIGEVLTLRLLRETWPNAVFDDCDSGEGEKHERAR